MSKPKTTVSKFADEADLVAHLCEMGDFEITHCDPAKWGGAYGWTTKGSDSTVCGYKTEAKARAGFIEQRAGGKLGAAMLKMLVAQCKSKQGLRKPRKPSTPTTCSPKEPTGKM